jgi:HSP20 family protein
MVEKSQNTLSWPTFFDPFRQMGSRLADWLSPASDASSDKDGYTITTELPGVAEDDIKLTVENGTLTITGEKKSEREESGDTWYFSERQFGSFSRSFRLPADADEQKVKADLKDGVLTVTIARRGNGAASKQIKVNKA